MTQTVKGLLQMSVSGLLKRESECAYTHAYKQTNIYMPMCTYINVYTYIHTHVLEAMISCL